MNEEVEKKAKILIVDDDESTRRSLTLILSRKGYDTDTAGTGQEVLEKTQQSFFNIALLDIRLPDVEGIELLAPLKEMHPEIVVIMITGYASVQTAVWALSEGAFAYITKPLNMHEVLATVREALEKQRLVEENRQKAERLTVIAELAKIISSSLDINDVYEAFAIWLSGLVDFEQVTITLVEEGNIRFLAVSSSVDTEFITGATMALPGTPTEWVMENGSTNIEGDFAQERQFPIDDVHFKEGMRAAIRLPLFSKGKVFGTFNLTSSHPHAYGKREQEILEDLTGQIVVAIENDQLFAELKRRQEELQMAYQQLASKDEALVKNKQELEDAYLNMARTTVLTQEAYEPYTQGHAERVTRLCQQIASEMGLSQEEMNQLETAARLHDLGRIGISKEILFKRTSLTPDERAEIKLHQERAAQQLRRPIKRLDGVLPIIEGYHEQYDGAGYPKGLKGAEIPLGARILAVTEAYDAMTSDRPYRPAMTSEEAEDALKQGVGSKWDPKVVETLLSVISKKT